MVIPEVEQHLKQFPGKVKCHLQSPLFGSHFFFNMLYQLGRDNLMNELNFNPVFKKISNGGETI